jgi:hypothetical protein
MSDKEGTLRMMASGRWAICRPGREPVEITSGELFRVEVDGELKLTRLRHFGAQFCENRRARHAPGSLAFG